MRPGDREIDDYAKLVVSCGVNLQPGRRLMIVNAPVIAPEIVGAIARRAYQAGAPLVEVIWSWDELLRTRLRYAPKDSFSEYPDWLAQAKLEAAKRGDAFVTLLSSDPDLLKDEDPLRVSQIVKTTSRKESSYAGLRMTFSMPWTVVSVPTVGWAQRVYPALPPETALENLWWDLFAFCRMDEGDPVATWWAHVQKIEERKRLMVEKQYCELRFEGPGTDLAVGLPDNQRWNGGHVTTPAGLRFSPNIPTEEVFTMPHRGRVDGVVAATRPVHFSGLIIKDLKLRLEQGAIVEAKASTGQEQIDQIIMTDDGAAHLGEVALVSHDSPIARAGRTYLNGLIDENAASHLALGQAYRSCIDGGDRLSDEEFRTAGGNVSAVHIDFMVGSEDLDVFGVTRDGAVEQVLRQGVWRL